MRIGILGSGLMGGKLGTIFARAGHEVVFTYARHKESWRGSRATPVPRLAREHRPTPRGLRRLSCWRSTGPA